MCLMFSCALILLDFVSSLVLILFTELYTCIFIILCLITMFYYDKLLYKNNRYLAEIITYLKGRARIRAVHSGWETRHKQHYNIHTSLLSKSIFIIMIKFTIVNHKQPRPILLSCNLVLAIFCADLSTVLQYTINYCNPFSSSQCSTGTDEK